MFMRRYFRSSFNWNLGGSIFYELTKTINQAALLWHIPYSLYGIIGITLSLIYIASRLSDLGAAHSFTSLYRYSTQSKKIFFRFLIINCILPSTIAACMASCIVFFILNKLNILKYYGTVGLCIITMLIIGETLRGILRSFLHIALYSKIIVILELASFLGYLLGIWYCIITRNLSSQLFLSIHLIDSSFIVCAFLLLLYKKYTTLPNSNGLNFEKISQFQIHYLKTKAMLARLSKDLVSHNTLTTLAGFFWGSEHSGNFFFVSNATNSVQAIIKNCITYPGNAFLANITNHNKKNAFGIMANYFLYLFIPCVVIGLTYHDKIFTILGTTSNSIPTFWIAPLTIILIAIDLLFSLYEQFYLAHKIALRLFFLKTFEFCILAYLLFHINTFFIESTLLILVATKLFCILTIIIDAYRIWKIHLPLHTIARHSFWWITIAIILKSITH